MKRFFLFFVAIYYCIYSNCIVAQPEIPYPNPAYMHWEEPCPDNLAYSQNYRQGLVFFPIIEFRSNYDTTILTNNHVCYINPFSLGEGKQTIYGVALCLSPRDNYEFPLPPIDRRISIDIMLYGFTSGDSNVQLVKSQTFEVEQGQSPDLFMLYSGSRNSTIKYPMYEFYFDTPIDIDVAGDYYFGIHSLDTFVVETGSKPYENRRPECCHSGYFGYVDMEREVLIMWESECHGRSWLGAGYYAHDSPGVVAPRTDTIFTNLAQGILPITRPQGYLTTTEPTAEAEAGCVRLLPNPARTRVTVEADCAIRHVEVADMAGRVLVSEQCGAGVRSATLDVSRLAQGSYVVRVKTERDETVQRLIIDN